MICSKSFMRLLKHKNYKFIPKFVCFTTAKFKKFSPIGMRTAPRTEQPHAITRIENNISLMKLLKLLETNPNFRLTKEECTIINNDVNSENSESLIQNQSLDNLEKLINLLVPNIYNKKLISAYISLLKKQDFSKSDLNKILKYYNLFNRFTIEFSFDKSQLNVYNIFFDNIINHFQNLGELDLITICLKIVNLKENNPPFIYEKEKELLYQNKLAILISSSFKNISICSYYYLNDLIPFIINTPAIQKSRMNFVKFVKESPFPDKQNLEKYLFFLALSSSKEIDYLLFISKCISDFKLFHLCIITDILAITNNQIEKVWILIIDQINENIIFTRENDKIINLILNLTKCQIINKVINNKLLLNIEHYIDNHFPNFANKEKKIKIIKSTLFLLGSSKVNKNFIKNLFGRIKSDINQHSFPEIYSLFKNYADDLNEIDIVINYINKLKLIDFKSIPDFKIYLDIIERDEKLALKLSNYLCDLILNWNKDKNIITFFELFYLCYKNNTFAKYEKIIDEINVILGNMMGNEYILIKLKQYNFLNQFVEMFENGFIPAYKSNIKAFEKINKHYLNK